jgi:hypothetical protein
MNTALLFISLISGFITILSSLYKHREEIVHFLKQSLNMVGPLILKLDNSLSPYKPALQLVESGFIRLFKFLCYFLVSCLFLMWHMEQSIDFTHFAVNAAYYLLMIGFIEKIIKGK